MTSKACSLDLTYFHPLLFLSLTYDNMGVGLQRSTCTRETVWYGHDCQQAAGSLDAYSGFGLYPHRWLSESATSLV